MCAPAEDDSNGSSSSNSSSNKEASSDNSSSGGNDTRSYKEQKAERDAEKSALLEALKMKLKAQLELAEASAGDPSAATDVAATAAQLRQWVDTASDKDYLLLHARVEAAAGRFAAALLALDKIVSPENEVPGPAAPEASQVKQKLLQALGWLHWKAYEEALSRVRFPGRLPPL
eukprot:GHUV01007913.1.p1 GENE.GHUV01007913.1~~GHUV01007913.1.p1  ORF type:complete len:186 (+),score=94.04 GHUV01007913.1:39-560(+)